MGMRSVPLGGVAAGAIALGLLGGSAMAAIPATAPKPRDVAAARSLIRAMTRYDQTVLQHKGAMAAAAKAMVAQVKAGCAGAITSSPDNGTPRQQAVFFDLVIEGVSDLTIDILHPVDHATTAFANGLDRVHISKRLLTRGIHATAKAQRGFVSVKPSDFCADVKVAVAGGFAADAPGTTDFLKILQRATSSSAKPVPNLFKSIKPYLLTRRDRAALKRLQTIDARYQNFSLNLGEKWAVKLARVLSAPPPARGGTGGFPTNPPPPASSPAAMTAAFALRQADTSHSSRAASELG
jgi:hypothetical protein